MPTTPKPTSSEPPDRPRIITIAFACWTSAAVLTAALGMLTLSQGGYPVVYFAGALLVAIGLGQAFLAGRARTRDGRFANAGVALAMTSIVFLALLLLLGAGIAVVAIVAVTMVLLIVGSVLIRREEARQWFENVR